MSKSVSFMVFLVVVLLISAVGYEVYCRANGIRYNQVQSKDEDVSIKNVDDVIDYESDNSVFYTNPNSDINLSDLNLCLEIISNIENEEYKKCLSENYSYDNVFGWSDKNELTYINLQNANLVIDELVIENIDSLESIKIKDNIVYKVFVKGCPKLKEIDVTNNQMKELYVIGMEHKIDLYCSNNQFTQEMKEQIEKYAIYLRSDWKEDWSEQKFPITTYSQKELDALEKIASDNLGMDFDRENPANLGGVTWSCDDSGEGTVIGLDFREKQLVGSLDLSAFTNLRDVECSATEVEEVILPEGIVKICDGGFLSCTKLKNIVLPKSVKYVGEYGFAYCDQLDTVTALGDNVRFYRGALSFENKQVTICYYKDTHVKVEPEGYFDQPIFEIIDKP